MLHRKYTSKGEEIEIILAIWYDEEGQPQSALTAPGQASDGFYNVTEYDIVYSKADKALYWHEVGGHHARAVVVGAGDFVWVHPSMKVCWSDGTILERHGLTPSSKNAE